MKLHLILTLWELHHLVPIKQRVNSPKYCYITPTPEPGWRDTGFVGKMKESFDIQCSRQLTLTIRLI
jgi:hypothetical protein